MLEALASGLPVAAFPVTGPWDVIGSADVGCLSEDLQFTCLSALKIPSQRCRAFAARQGWEAAARAFVSNISGVGCETGAPAKYAPEPQLAI